MLFEKYQKNQLSKSSTNVVTINHSVKELVWITQMQKYTSGRTFLYYNAILDRKADLGKLVYNATVRFVLKTAMYSKPYKVVPHQKGITKSYSTLAEYNEDEALVNKTIIQNRGPKMNQLEFAILATQASSFCPKTIVHF